MLGVNDNPKAHSVRRKGRAQAKYDGLVTRRRGQIAVLPTHVATPQIVVSSISHVPPIAQESDNSG